MGRVAWVAAAAAALLACAASAHASLVARPLGRALVLRAGPGGTSIATLGRRTEFGSPLVLAVAARRGRWLGVITPLLPNGRVAWVDARSVRTSEDRLRLDVSLGAQRLELTRGTKVLARVRVGIGAPGSPTPTGTFAVTDELAGARFSSVYGCCILALSGHQPHPRAGWTGSDTRIAIHGGAFGAVSNGCLHATTAALRFLMAHVPLGTRVTIRR
jgi:lipoprotein-anchoring transpeptidase ErfK/SrfK